MGRPEPSEIANRLPLTATDPSVRAAAVRAVLKHTRTRADEDVVLYAVGLHYRPEAGTVRRDPIHGSRAIRETGAGR